MSLAKPALILEAGNSVLLIIDIQTRLTAVMPAKVLARLQRITAFLLKSAKILDIPVFVTEQYPKGLGKLEDDIAKLLPENTKRYEKTSFSCTGAENFLDDLAQLGHKQIVLAGMEAHVCVMQTALHLLNLDYHVVVVGDGAVFREISKFAGGLDPPPLDVQAGDLCSPAVWRKESRQDFHGRRFPRPIGA